MNGMFVWSPSTLCVSTLLRLGMFGMDIDTIGATIQKRVPLVLQTIWAYSMVRDNEQRPKIWDLELSSKNRNFHIGRAYKDEPRYPDGEEVVQHVDNLLHNHWFLRPSEFAGVPQQTFDYLAPFGAGSVKACVSWILRLSIFFKDFILYEREWCFRCVRERSS